jgi:hypothetical protein
MEDIMGFFKWLTGDVSKSKLGTLTEIKSLTNRQKERIVIEKGEANELKMDVAKWGIADEKLEFELSVGHDLSGHQMVAQVSDTITASIILEEICPDHSADLKRILFPIDNGSAIIILFGNWSIHRRLKAIKTIQKYKGKVIFMTASETELRN